MIQINRIESPNTILTSQESNLVQSKELTRLFGLPEDFIQFFVFNNNGSLINQNPNYKNYNLNDNKIIEFDPETDIVNLGYQIGTYQLVYNLLRPVITKNSNLDLFIKSISQDRKEIKIGYTGNQNTLYTNSLSYINQVQNRDYFVEFYLDFGNNNLISGLKIAVERDINNNSFLVIKLNQPLPADFDVNYPLNIVEEISNTIVYEAILTQDPIVPEFPSLKQANFSIEVDDKRIGSSKYFNKDSIIEFPESASTFTLLSEISASNSKINVDYTDFSNFIHFSSISQRVNSFYEKIKLIEDYKFNINEYPSSVDTALNKKKIQKVIEGFDDYEKFLYYETGSIAWPKSTIEKPYELFSYSSSQVEGWYNDTFYSASYYDEFNQNNLINGLPIYIQEKDDFKNVKPFIHSMGQLFDDIWLYIKAYTDLWKSENKLTEGISRDLVDNALQSLGIPLYTDGDQDNIDLWLNGLNEEGKYTYQTSSLEPNITQIITGSKYTLSGQQEAKNLFKRIYHNLPTLLKSKGTSKFYNYFNTLYGTPETILYPQEYGGVDKTSDVEYKFSKYTYGIEFRDDLYLNLVRNNIGFSPYGFESLEFRFNPNIYTTDTQTLLVGVDNNNGGDIKWGVTLNYSSSNGYDYGVVDLIGYNTTLSKYVSSSVSLPIYTTGSNQLFDWWNFTVVEESPSNYRFYVQNNVGDKIGFNNTGSLSTDPFDTNNNTILFGNVPPSINGNPINITPPFGTGLSRVQIQEVRGWSEKLDRYTIDAHTLNPESYIGNTTSSAYNNLLFRYPLGNDLNIPENPINIVYGAQPKQTKSSYVNFVGNWKESDFKSFTEEYYSLPAVGGYSTPNTTKIRIDNTPLATNKLYPYKSVKYAHPVSSSRTNDIHLSQTGLSPQDQINNDIIAHLGDTYNLDNIIGDPALGDKVSYYELDYLRTEYFKKYQKRFNYQDFLQLVETFHKSLWRYISHFTPARVTEATGLVIKPHILERSKIKRYEPTLTHHDYSGSMKLVTVTGSNPGEFCCSRNSPLNEAFYTGDLSGSVVDVNDNYLQNPFSVGICHCKEYEVTVDGAALFFIRCNDQQAGNGNIGIYPLGVGVNKVKIKACNDEFSSLFGTVYSVRQVGDYIKKDGRIHHFKEQYGGWNSLDNNVSSSIISSKKWSQEFSTSSLWGPCYRQDITSLNVLPQTITYTTCDDKSVSTTIPPFGSIYNIESVDVFNISNNPWGINSTIREIVYLPYDKRTYITSSIEFQDSLLTETSYKRSRYDGVETISEGFNQDLIDGSIPGNFPQTNAEKNQTYIAFSDWAGNTLASRYGSSNFHIKWLIDESGSVYKPENSSSYYWNTDQNFGGGTPVNISSFNNAGSSGVEYETTVYRPLRRYETIIHSATGSLGTDSLQPGYYNSINFSIDPFIELQDYNFDGSNSITIPTFTLNQDLDFPTITTDSLGGWNSTNKTWTYNSNIPFLTKLELTTIDTILTTPPPPSNFNITIYKNGSPVLIQNQTMATTVSTNLYLYPGDVINAKYSGGNVDLNINFTIAPIFTSTSVTPNYWSTVGSSITDQLVASTDLSAYYGAYKQNKIDNSGFSSPILFTLQKYDEIRFGNNEKNVYTIMHNYISPVNNRLNIVLDREINSNEIDIQNFTIRRLVNDPGFIMINNNPKYVTGPGGGSFIIPKYLKQSMRDNLNNIINKLYTENLI